MIIILSLLYNHSRWEKRPANLNVKNNMQKAVLILFFGLCFKLSNAQFYDKAWLIGGGTMVKLTFNGNSIDTSSFYWNTAITLINSSACNVSDTFGNLLFYSNGADVGNSLSQIMENGDTLTDSLFYNYFRGGFIEPQTSLILPKSGNTFYLFYYSQSDSLFATQTIAEPDRLYYAVIDMDANGGLGKVVSKKKTVYKGLFGDSRLTACRHANGMDWWMVHQGFQNNEYFVYLVTPDSIYGPNIQLIGPSDFAADNLGAQSVFSPDGSKFATIAIDGPLLLMDFDRCTGLFSNPDTFAIPPDTLWYNGQDDEPGGGGGSGVCFSASGRFLYMSDVVQVAQYDTWAPDIAASRSVIGKWDSVGPRGGDLGLYQMYLLPNGKIIIDNYQGGGRSYGLIDSPNAQGLGCHFHFNGLPTSTLNANVLPNMINYRLGALPSSACDTLTGIGPQTPKGGLIRVYPNPANETVQVDVANRDLSEPIYFVLFDMLGQEILRSDIPLYQIQISRHSIAAGIYTWQIQNSAGEAKANGKLVWE